MRIGESREPRPHSSRAERDFYADAAVYDILHSPGTAEELDGVESLATRLAPAPILRQWWLEPACGTGRLVRLAARRGRRCIGFDRSPVMVAYARRRLAGLPARLIEADMESFADLVTREVGEQRIGVAFNIINTIRHLDSDDAFARHLRDMARVLAPRGLYIVGISLSAYGLEYPSEDVWHGARGKCSVTQVVNYIPPVTPAEIRRRSERVLSHLAVRRGTREEHIDSTYTLRTWNLSQWRAAIAACGWSVIDVADDAGNPCEPGEPGYTLWALTPRP